MARPLKSIDDAAVNERVDEVLQLLRARGGRVTTSRRLLLHCLFESSAHLTAEAIAAAVQREAPDVHLSTIYRNLDELEQLGIITHSHLGHGPVTYHLLTTAHGHLVCDVCSRTFEVTDRILSALAKDAFDQFGFVIDPHHFAVLGRCKACARSANASANVEHDGARTPRHTKSAK